MHRSLSAVTVCALLYVAAATLAQSRGDEAPAFDARLSSYDYPYQVPTLLIIGQRDKTALGKPLVSNEVAARMGDHSTLDKQVAATIPNAKLVELESVGHIPQFEAWDAYADALTEFLDTGL